MKTYTFKEAVKLMVDGKIIKDKDDDLWKIEENGYFRKPSAKSHWFLAGAPFDPDFAPFTLYEEPPKPENKVIVIKHLLEFAYVVDGLPFNINYRTENDAIRAAMEWVGENTRVVGLKKPEWANGNIIVEREYGVYRQRSRDSVREALLMRWPIEVLEEAK